MKKGWTKKIPTKVGLYKMISDEKEKEESYVAITKCDNGTLVVHDPDIGRFDLKTYHNNLINLKWFHVA